MASENSEPYDSQLNFYNSMIVTALWTIKKKPNIPCFPVSVINFLFYVKLLKW